MFKKKRQPKRCRFFITVSLTKKGNGSDAFFQLYYKLEV